MEWIYNLEYFNSEYLVNKKFKKYDESLACISMPHFYGFNFNYTYGWFFTIKNCDSSSKNK